MIIKVPSRATNSDNYVDPIKSHRDHQTHGKLLECERKLPILRCHEQNHLLKNTTKINYKCTFCYNIFRTKNDLKNHVCRVTLSSDENQKFSVCKVCDKQFIHKNILNKHMETHMNFECVDCGLEFVSKQELDQHRKSHLEDVEWSCFLCSKKFQTERQLENHNHVHDWLEILDDTFDCDDAKLIFQSHDKFSSDTNQLLANTSMNDNHCTGVVIIDATNSQTNNSTQSATQALPKSEANAWNADAGPNANHFDLEHVFIHSGSADKPEPICDSNGFNCEQHASDDQRQNHQLVQSIVDSSESVAIKCGKCDMTFHTNNKKLEHECLVHKPKIVLSRIDVTTVINFVAEQNQDNFCEDNFRQDNFREDTTVDMLNVTQRKVALESTHATIHCSRHNDLPPANKPTKFQCNLCKRYLANKKNLMRHQKIHSNERPFKCCHCDKAFARNDKRLSHERNVHKIKIRKMRK